MKEFLISELMLKFDAPSFISYVRHKIDKNFARRLSYYETLKNTETYVPVTTNASESQNSILNRFLVSLSKSSKLITIIRNSRQFFTSEYRQAESQWEKQNSDYRPSANAQSNFLKAKAFIRKIDKTSLKPHKLTLKKISKLMDPNNFYGSD